MASATSPCESSEQLRVRADNSFRCFYHGKTFTLMPPNLPLTSANICRIIRTSPTPPVQHFAVPYVLKLLGETQEGIETLATFEAVSFAGAAVPVRRRAPP